MSWPDFLPPGPGGPVPAAPLRDLILAALAEAFLTRMTGGAFCRDCMNSHGLCPDHLADHETAAAYEAAYMRVRGIGSDGAMLTLTGGLA